MVGDVTNRYSADLGKKNPAVTENREGKTASRDVVTPASSPERNVPLVIVERVWKRRLLGSDQDADDRIRVADVSATNVNVVRSEWHVSSVMLGIGLTRVRQLRERPCYRSACSITF